MTAAARTYAPAITEPQRKAIFAIARDRGLAIDDVRALCPQHSISRLTVGQAADLIDRLNGKKTSRPGARRSGRPATRKTSTRNVTRLISADQLDYIDKLRICMGWTRQALGEHLDTRKYLSDPSRKMSVMQSSPDAVAVIEHLRKIVARKLHFAGVKARLLPPGEPDVNQIKPMMQKLPPHEAIAALFANRCAKWREANPGDDWSAWADSEQIACGKRASCPTTCAEMARLIARMEAELVTDDAAAENLEIYDGVVNRPHHSEGVIAKIGGAT